MVGVFGLGVFVLVFIGHPSATQVTLAPPLITTQPSTSVRYALLLKELALVTEKRAALQNRLQQYRTTYNNLQQQLDVKRGLDCLFFTLSLSKSFHAYTNISL